MEVLKFGVNRNVFLCTKVLFLPHSDDSEDETSEDTDDDEDEGGKKGGQVVDEALAAEVTQLAEKRKVFLLTKVRKLH